MHRNRATIKGQVTRILNFLELETTAVEAQDKLQKLEDFFRNFEMVQYLIKAKKASLEEEEFKLNIFITCVCV